MSWIAQPYSWFRVFANWIAGEDSEAELYIHPIFRRSTWRAVTFGIMLGMLIVFGAVLLFTHA